MGTKLKPGAFDCYENAEPDEPMFVLLARDWDAPRLVNLWADRREAHGGPSPKVEEARACARAMYDWRDEREQRDGGVTALRAVEPCPICGHWCCDMRNEPSHDHFLSSDKCPACALVVPSSEFLESRRAGISRTPEASHPARTLGATCPWCGCIGYHAEFCRGFEVNDPASAGGRDE